MVAKGVRFGTYFKARGAEKVCSIEIGGISIEDPKVLSALLLPKLEALRAYTR